MYYVVSYKTVLLFWNTQHTFLFSLLDCGVTRKPRILCKHVLVNFEQWLQCFWTLYYQSIDEWDSRISSHNMYTSTSKVAMMIIIHMCNKKIMEKLIGWLMPIMYTATCTTFSILKQIVISSLMKFFAVSLTYCYIW